MYVYRVWPVINRKLAGEDNPNYIAVWPLNDEAITEDRLLDQFGSGRYRLLFNDQNRPKPLRQVADTLVKLQNPERLPVVDPCELVMDDRDNASYIQTLRARGALKEPKMARTGSDVAVEELAATTRRLLDRQEKGGGQVDLLLKLAELLRPKVDPLQTAIQIAELKGRGDDPGILKAVLDSQAKMHEQQTQFQQAVLEFVKSQQRAGGGGELESLERILRIAKEIGFAPRGGGEGGGVGEAVAAVADSIPGILQAGASLLSVWGAIRVGRVPVPPQPIIQPALEPAAEEEAQEPEVVPEKTEMPGVGVSGNQVARLAGVGQQAVEAFQRGISGRKFASSLKTVEPDIHAMLGDLGKDNVLMVLRSHPQIWAPLEPRQAEIEQWLNDFFGAGSRAKQAQ